MTVPFNPWPTNPPNRGGEGRRITRLVGKESKKVFVLVKMHNWGGRAIYLYNLINGQMIHIPRPSDEEWEQYLNAPGVTLQRPPSLQATDDTGWINYAKREATRLGLSIEE